MSDAFKAFGGAVRDLFHPRMLLLAVLPMLAALLLWLGFAWAYWSEWVRWIDGWLSVSVFQNWLPAGGLFGFGDVARYAANVLLVLLLIPLVLATAGMLAAVLAMPLIVNFVAARRYPALMRRQGGSFAGSVLNATIAVGGFATLWVCTLPLWLSGVLGPPLALLLSAWLNQRLFFYDALAEHATAEEFRRIRAATRGRRYLLGLLVAAFYVVPLANLLVPVLCGLAFTHFALAQLAAQRALIAANGG
jgi:uncharacterized protein involved in cysteine biosynthesis